MTVAAARRRDHGLARADIALQEAQHALRPREIGVDLGERRLWLAVRLKGRAARIFA